VLWIAAVGLVLAWIVGLLSSLALGGWVHLLPIVAAALVVARLTRNQVETGEFARWKRARRGAR